MRSLDEVINLSESQRGLVTVGQLADLGLDRHARRDLIQGPHWELLTTRVLRRRGAPRTEEQRVLAAVLDAGPGAQLMGPTAAAWWGLKGFDLRILHVERPREGNRQRQVQRPLAFVHLPRFLPAHHCTTFEGIPVVRPARFAFELAAMVHPKRAERAVDNAWTLRLVSGRSLHTLAEEMYTRGRPGGPVMRAILSTRPLDYVPPASNLESRFCSILADAGDPPMRRQIDVGDDEGWVGRVDFVDDDRPFIVEINSEKYHTSLLDKAADDLRYARLRRVGYTVRAFTDVEVWTRPRHVLDEVRAARRRIAARRVA